MLTKCIFLGQDSIPGCKCVNREHMELMQEAATRPPVGWESQGWELCLHNSGVATWKPIWTYSQTVIWWRCLQAFQTFLQGKKAHKGDLPRKNMTLTIEILCIKHCSSLEKDIYMGDLSNFMSL